MDTAQLLNLVTDIGCELLENGAETYRVEDTMQRVFHAYGYTDADVFVIPTCMTISITPSHKHSIAKNPPYPLPPYRFKPGGSDQWPLPGNLPEAGPAGRSL